MDEKTYAPDPRRKPACASARIDQFALAEKLLTAAGMTPVGIDHFVAPGDSMLTALHNKSLARNFQGYTIDNADTLIGFGMSSIGRTREGFFQNAANITDYSSDILGQKIPTRRGRKTSDEDALRAEIISDLMCYLETDLHTILAKHKKPVDYFSETIDSLKDLADDGLVTIEHGHIRIHLDARHLARVVVARFDAYFLSQQKRHAQAA